MVRSIGIYKNKQILLNCNCNLRKCQSFQYSNIPFPFLQNEYVGIGCVMRCVQQIETEDGRKLVFLFNQNNTKAVRAI